MSTGSAAGDASSVNVEMINEQLQQNLPKDVKVLNPEATDWDKVGFAVADDGSVISKYRLSIKTVGSEYNVLPVTFYIRDGLHSYKDLRCLWMGKYLSGIGGFYEENYSLLQAASNGSIIAVGDRPDVNIPQGADPDPTMESADINRTTAEYFVETAASKLVASALMGIPADSIKTSIIVHSLSGPILVAYDPLYQDLPLGHFDNMVLIDTLIKYDSVYTDLIASQADQYDLLQGEIKNGNVTVGDMSDNMDLARGILANDFFSGAKLKTFRLGVGRTHWFMSNPPNPDYHYLSLSLLGETAPLAGGGEYDILQKIAGGGVCPYGSKKLAAYMAGVNGNLILVQNLHGANILVIPIDGGFWNYGREWFAQQPNVEFYDEAGDGGHLSIVGDSRYSPKIWEKTFSFIDSKNND